MVGVKLTAQVFIAASGWFSGDPDVASPLTSAIQRRLDELPRVRQRQDELQRQVEELKRAFEEQQRKQHQWMRQIHLDRWMAAEDNLAESRKRLQSLEIEGPPTKIDALFIDNYKSWQADLELRIKQERDALQKLDPPSKLESK